ncbi:lpsA [Symbiodinium natans]|uniref:LpsA protein n=1 Tax=Symbiodinium natans TaxID=878477 RepID=A0A812UTH6_9DINO|nr:lpsA [Symbiodinium natans]
MGFLPAWLMSKAASMLIWCLCLLPHMVLALAGEGFAPCWSRGGGFNFQECCGSAEHAPNPSCFDSIYTEELCCMEADWDVECWQHARLQLADVQRVFEAQASAGMASWAQMDAIRRYTADDMLLYLFCCNAFHNEYCWGPAIHQALLPDPDAWEGVSDISAWYPRCCFPRLRGMLKAPMPVWMRRQISRDLRAMSMPGRPGLPWPSKQDLQHFTGSLPEDGQEPHQELFRFCDYHVMGADKVRHCNFTRRGYHPRRYLRARVFARAMTVLAARGELPDAEVSFVLSHSDVEWHDQALPVLTFQRGKATTRVVRTPMWEQLDGSWSRKVEHSVRMADGQRLWRSKVGKQAFWRGTDSGVPAQDCHPERFRSCSVNNHTWRDFHRLKLARMASTMPHRVDAALSGVKQRAKAIGLDLVYTQLGLLHPPLRELSIEEQLRRRLLLDLDGSSQSTRLYWGLLSNSVVLKQDTKCCNWYSDRLRDQVHIFRVRRDLADVPRQVLRSTLRPSLARSVARRSARLARRWLSHEDAMHYLARVILAVAEAQGKG